MSTDVQSPRGCVMSLHHMDPRHESSDLHVIVCVFGKQVFSWNVNLRRTGGKVTEKTTFLLDQEKLGSRLHNQNKMNINGLRAGSSTHLPCPHVQF